MSKEWKSLTERERKHKEEYMKAGKLEVAFAKLIRNTKTDYPQVDTKNTKVLYGTSTLKNNK